MEVNLDRKNKKEQSDYHFFESIVGYCSFDV